MCSRIVRAKISIKQQVVSRIYNIVQITFQIRKGKEELRINRKERKEFRKIHHL